ncbi:MAG: sugar ABC transporter substrate-binding protein [Pyramidobacter sp.]|jgi:DNA-binding LacI/PurR family transcriptional regulator
MAYELAILFGDLINPYWQEQELWYRKYLPDFPFNAQIVHLRGSLDAEEQADLCRRLMQDNLDALIVNALDKEALGRAAAGVKSRTVLVDAGPKIDPDVAGAIAHYLPLKVCDYQEQGKLCVQALLEQKKNIRRLGCIGGPQEALQSRARVIGAISALGDFPKAEKQILWSDFTRQGGEESMERLMDWKPDALFCANDLMALGAWDVLHAAGRKIPVGGIDMIPSAVFSVRNGGMAATVGVNGSDVVRGLLRAVDDYLSFGIIARDFLAHNQVVTSSGLHAQGCRKGLLF